MVFLPVKLKGKENNKLGKYRFCALLLSEGLFEKTEMKYKNSQCKTSGVFDVAHQGVRINQPQ
ncbi:hypothetical protein NBRC116595_40060 [Aliiglaciecola sp. NS0011-25]